MNQSQCGYCYRPDCHECSPPITGNITFGPAFGLPSNPVPFKMAELAPTPTMTYTAVALRDQLAIAALQSLLVKSPDPTRGRINASDEKCYAEQAYNYADAMLKARSR